MMGFIRRQKYLMDFTLASLLRRKGKNLGLLLVYSMIVFLLAVNHKVTSTTNSFTKQFEMRERLSP